LIIQLEQQVGFSTSSDAGNNLNQPIFPSEPVNQTNDVAISFIIPLYVIILEIDNNTINVTIVFHIRNIVLCRMLKHCRTDKPCNLPPKNAERNIHGVDVVSKLTTYSDDCSPTKIGIVNFTCDNTSFIGKKSFDVTVKKIHVLHTIYQMKSSYVR